MRNVVCQGSSPEPWDPRFLQGASMYFPKVFIGPVPCQVPSAKHNPRFRTPRGKQIFSINHIVRTNSSAQGALTVRSLPKSVFPNASQGPNCGQVFLNMAATGLLCSLFAAQCLPPALSQSAVVTSRSPGSRVRPAGSADLSHVL